MSVNKVILVGNVGKILKSGIWIRTLQLQIFRMATSESLYSKKRRPGNNNRMAQYRFVAGACRSC